MLMLVVNCYYRESQLKEALEDLSSAKVITDILQKELLATKVVSASCTDQLASSKEPNNEVTADERSFSANKTSFGIQCQGYIHRPGHWFCRPRLTTSLPYIT